MSWLRCLVTLVVFIGLSYLIFVKEYKPSEQEEQFLAQLTEMNQEVNTVLGELKKHLSDFDHKHHTECPESLTCFNGGTCVSMLDTVQCICRWRYTGQYCEKPLMIIATVRSKMSNTVMEVDVLDLDVEHPMTPFTLNVHYCESVEFELVVFKPTELHECYENDGLGCCDFNLFTKTGIVYDLQAGRDKPSVRSLVVKCEDPDDYNCAMIGRIECNLPGDLLVLGFD